MNTVSHVIHDNAQSRHSSSNIAVYRTLITQMLISRNKQKFNLCGIPSCTVASSDWDWMQGSFVDREVPDDTCGSWIVKIHHL